MLKWTSPKEIQCDIARDVHSLLDMPTKDGLRTMLLEEGGLRMWQESIAQVFADKLWSGGSQADKNLVTDFAERLMHCTLSIFSGGVGEDLIAPTTGAEDPNWLVGPVLLASAFNSTHEQQLASKAFLEQRSASSAAPVSPGEEQVAMGVVDISIGYLNSKFRNRSKQGRTYPDETRFEMIWLMDRRIRSQYRSPWSNMLPMGTLLLRKDIDEQIKRHWSDGRLDEESAYREFETEAPFNVWSNRSGHGTLVLDHMAGAEPEKQTNDRPIYAVDLPTSIVADTSGDKLFPPVLLALNIISVLSVILPIRDGSQPASNLCINASLASTGGPDGGLHPNAKRVREAVRSSCFGGMRKVSLTVPAGNHLQDQVHAVLGSGARSSIEIVVPPDDRTASFVEIFQEGFCGSLDVEALEVQPPGHEPLRVEELPEPGETVSLEFSGVACALLARPINRGADMLELVLAPTHSYKAGVPLAPVGIWRLYVKSSKKAGDWLLWIRRDDTLDGFRPAGRQTRFRDPNYQKYTDLGAYGSSDIVQYGIKRAGTASILYEAGGDVIGVDGVQATAKTSSFELYRLNGLPRRGGTLGRTVPLAYAEDSRAYGGLMSSTRLSQGTLRKAGTSFASGIVSRLIADELLGQTTGGPKGRRKIRNW